MNEIPSQISCGEKKSGLSTGQAAAGVFGTLCRLAPAGRSMVRLWAPPAVTTSIVQARPTRPASPLISGRANLGMIDPLSLRRRLSGR